MASESFRSRPESSSNEAALAPETALRALQAQVALLSYREHHSDTAVDFEQPENNPSEIRNGAMMEWVTDGSAAEFRAYLDSHALTESEAEDPRQILAAMHAEGDTLH